MSTQTINDSQSEISLEHIRELVKCFSPKRADKDQAWFNVGVCLSNIDISLLDSWIEFSKKSSKFIEGKCEKIWTTLDQSYDCSITSLRYWAKIDNLKAFEVCVRNNITKDILKSQSQTTQDIATVVYKMYQYEYKCESIKNDIWFEFKNDQWEQMYSGVLLIKKIGNEVVNEYLKLITYYNAGAAEQHDEQQEEYLQKSKNLTDVTYKLRDYDYKETILKELTLMFYDPEFEGA